MASPFDVQVELNSDGKIQLEETINESIINGNADTTANVSDSTFDESKNGTQNSDKLDASGVESTAAVLSIDDPESGEIFKNHLICNNVNNNHIPSKPAAAGVVVTTAPAATAESDNIEPIQIALNKSTVASSKNGDATIDEKSTATAATITNSNTNAKANEANGDVVNNDNDTTKRLSNHSNTDAANSVGFPPNPHLHIHTHKHMNTHVSRDIDRKQNILHEICMRAVFVLTLYLSIMPISRWRASF